MCATTPRCFGASQPRAYTALQIKAMYEAVGLTLVDGRYGEPEKAGERVHYVAVGELSDTRPV